MAQAQCNNHGLVEAVWKEGTSKAGKSYAFWACPNKEKDQYGNFIKCKVQVANTPSGKFDQQLDKASAQMDAQKKDETITRLAIAKSFIEAGKPYSLDTVKEMERFLAWVEKRAQSITPQPELEPVTEEEGVKLEDIPF